MPDFFQGYELILALSVLLTPVLSSILTQVLKNEKVIGNITVTLSSVTFLFALVLSLNLLLGDNVYQQIEWFSLGQGYSFHVGVLLDELTAVMLVVVTFVSLMVYIFSKGYMVGDKSYRRYFALLGLFTFSMLGIVIADNLLLLFVFWELVGFTSYLLIGFWYEKHSASIASKKAFIVNRIGDLGFVVAIMILWSQYGSLDFLLLQDNTAGDPFWINMAGLGLLCGVMGKSAQFPLQVWLPDAMEGPTPVSALIHAATMVVAGIFLLARIFVILPSTILDLITLTGAITAFMGAIAAIKQYDIKKVLAFSTISQLGYMVMGMGVGATGGAIFHLVTHAFFKACLFLSAGAVIYWMHHQLDEKSDPQDMRLMGGLRRQIPLVFITFLISAMSLAGLPFFSGFLSKDAILSAVIQWATNTNNSFSVLVMILSFGSVLLTAYYMTRQVLMVFFGSFRNEGSNHMKPDFRLPFSMKIPLILLAVGATWLLFSANPINGSWLITLFSSDFEKNIPHNIHTNVSIVAFVLSIVGIVFSLFRFKYYKGDRSGNGVVKYINQLSTNNWYLDDIYQITFMSGTLWIANIAKFIEVHFVDRLVNYIGIFHIVLSRVIGWGDRYVIDGAVHLTTSGIYSIGKVAKNIQGDHIQRYIITALISIIIMTIGLTYYLAK